MAKFLAGVATGVCALLLCTVIALYAVSAPAGSAAAGDPSSASRGSASPSAAPTPTSQGETSLSEVTLTSTSIVSSTSDLREVSVTAAGVTAGPDGLVAHDLTLEATLPFAAAAAQVGQAVTLSAAPNGRAQLDRTVTVLGRDIRVRAIGTVSADTGELVIQPESVDLQGPDWLDSVASTLVRELVAVRQPVQGLPTGSTLTSVRVGEGGFRVTVTGSHVRLDP